MTKEEKEIFKKDIIESMRDVFTLSHSVTVQNSSITGSAIAVIKEHIANIDRENTIRNGNFTKAVDSIEETLKDFRVNLNDLQKSKSNIATAFWWIGAFITIIILPIVGYISLEVLQLSKTVSAISIIK